MEVNVCGLLLWYYMVFSPSIKWFKSFSSIQAECCLYLDLENPILNRLCFSVFWNLELYVLKESQVPSGVLEREIMSQHCLSSLPCCPLSCCSLLSSFCTHPGSQQYPSLIYNGRVIFRPVSYPRHTESESVENGLGIWILKRHLI